MFDFLFFIPLGLAIAAYFLVGPLLGILAWFKHERRFREEKTRRDNEHRSLQAAYADLKSELAALRGDAPGPDDLTADADRPAAEAPEPTPPTVQASIVEPPSVETAAPEPVPTRASAAPGEPETTATPAPAGGPRPRKPGSLEESLASRWLVWLGAATVALGSIFLVKYSIDQGWLGPTVRVIFGNIFGLALIAAGEWLRRRPLQRAIAALRPDYVPPALTAAGLFAGFASTYAAFSLHALISPLTAFIIMAVYSLLSVGLAILQGPFVALLGLIGGYLTPLLAQTGHPLAWGLFPYLFLISAAAMALVRYMAWRWLAWAVIAGALIWVPVWYVSTWQTGDTVPVGLYLLALAALLAPLLSGLGRPPEQALSATQFLQGPEFALWVAAVAIALLFHLLVRLDEYSFTSLTMLTLMGGGYLLFARWRQRFDGIAILAFVVMLAVYALWFIPDLLELGEPLYRIEGKPYGRAPGPNIPPALWPFLTAGLLFGALFAGAGYLALWGSRRTVIWSGLSGAAPVLFLLVAYWRVEAFGIAIWWALPALAVALVGLAAAERIRRYRFRPGIAEALGLYAAAIVAAVSLALTMTLRDAWLSVALSLQLPALAWISQRLEVTFLRKVATVIAVVLLIRLVLNPALFDYNLAGWAIFNWLLYGYGIPAIACFVAARGFGKLGAAYLTILLEAAGLTFFVLLLSLEVRYLMTGSLDARYEFQEACIQLTIWLTLAYMLARKTDWQSRPAFLWAWRGLLVLCLAQTGYFLVLAVGLLRGEPVGDWPLFNWLILGYAVPGLYACLFARLFQNRGYPRLARIAAILALALFFAFITLEIRHAFHGGKLWHGHAGNGEEYSYSMAWLTYGLLLLALGVWRRAVQLRWASLAVVMITVAKVFLIDFGALEGLYRVASFVGLGLSLIGIGFFYQRFVFPPPAPPATE